MNTASVITEVLVVVLVEVVAYDNDPDVVPLLVVVVGVELDVVVVGEVLLVEVLLDDVLLVVLVLLIEVDCLVPVGHGEPL